MGAGGAEPPNPLTLTTVLGGRIKLIVTATAVENGDSQLSAGFLYPTY